MSTVSILIEIDALLDTRLAVMDRLDPEAAVRLASNPDYYTRMIDHMEPLCGIDEATYQEAWNKRSFEDLKHALATPMVDFLHYQALDLARKVKLEPTVEGAEYVINLFPYRIPLPDETALHNALSQRFGHAVPIKLVFLSPKEIEPLQVRSKYAGLVFYNHHLWIRTHQEVLTKIGIPQITLVVPKLCYEKVPTEEEQKLDIDRPMDIWTFTAKMSAEAFGTEFMEVEMYCSYLGKVALLRAEQEAKASVEVAETP
jgi:hypothetical protein